MRSNCCNVEVIEQDICSKCKEHCEPMRSDEEIKKIPFGELNPSELARAAEIVNQINERHKEEFCN